MTKKLAGTLLAALIPLVAGAQEAAPAAPPPPAAASTYHRHVGFFLRPELGFSYFATSASQGGLDLKLSGTGVNLGIAIGGAIKEDFILGFHAWDYVVSGPDVTLNGQTATASSDSSVALVGYGVLLNWYFANDTYLALTPSLTKITTDDGTSSATSDWGFGLRTAFGKEWWVSDHWGIGLAGSLALSSNQDSGSGSPTWGSWALGLNFSATYN